MSLVCALACAGCGQRALSYGRQEIVRLEEGEPAPWTGWLVSDADLELLLKAAEGAAGQ